MKNFGKRILEENARRKYYEMAMRHGAKEFADKLNEAREKDALELFEQAKKSIDGLSESGKRYTLCVLACNKLYDVGYREFANLFKQTLKVD